MYLKKLQNIQNKKSEIAPWSVLKFSSLLSFILTCSITYFAINVFHTLHSEIDGLKSDELDSMTMLSDSNSSYTQLRVNYLNYFHLNSFEQKRVRITDKVFIASIKKNWDKFLKTRISSNENGPINAWLNSYQSFLQSREHFFQLIDEKKIQEAKTFQNNLIYKLPNQASVGSLAISQLINFHHKIAASRIERTDNITNQKVIFLYFLFGMASCLSIINYVLSKNKIKKYLLQLLKTKIELQQNLEVVHSSAIVSTTDIAGNIIEVNDNFCSISGYSREELIGANHRLVNSGAHSKEFFQSIWQTILSGRSWSGEIQNKTKAGEPYWVHTYISPLYDENRKINRFHSIRFDITEKKLALHQIEHTAKMATLGQMAGAIAHEINNPLAIICGTTHILKRLIAKDQIDVVKFNEALLKIEATGSRISKIIKGLSSISRNSENDPFVHSPISTVVMDTIELCKERFSHHGIELRVINNCGAEIDCRASELGQVILNLLNNAHDAVEMLPLKWVELEVKSNDKLVMLSVTDSGNGIKEEIIAKMMTPYFTTKEVGKGTGLGLSISKRIIIEHNGNFKYDTFDGHTRFTIEIPKFQNVVELKAA